MSVFKEGSQLHWQVPTLKKSFSSVVTMKHKLEKGIILSWEGYAENYVSYFLLCFFYYCTMSFHPNVYLNQDNLWIHHWVILQFVNPLFSVPTHHDLSGVGPDGFRKFQFKHKTACSSFVGKMSWNLSITIVLMRFHILVWSGLDSVWMSKAFGWLIVFTSNRM